MDKIIIFIVGVLVGGFLVWVIKRRKSGFAAFNLKRQQAKKEGKKKILKLLKDKTSISNNDVERLLSVSDATATNYLQELENEGKIVQIGKTGRSVSYSLKING
ncbi:DeoR family transcriptional regulator [Patescibacteria group bacterium]|nr:DeoR family transcriptional regulator [Patescibacteria group bacterium]